MSRRHFDLDPGVTLGHEIAGTIASIGEGVTGLEARDWVGVPTASGGPGQAIDGGFAEQVNVGADWAIALADRVSFSGRRRRPTPI